MTDVTFHGHSGVGLTKDGESLFIDPGTFSDLGALPAAAAVLITHEHPDHIAPGALAGSQAPIWAPAGLVAKLAESGVAPSRLNAVAPGESFTAAGFSVTVHGGNHADIYHGFPGIANNAYVIDERVLHPGDSFPVIAQEPAFDLVLLPVAAPWLKISEAIDFAKSLGASHFAPIHDGFLNDAGRALSDAVLGRFLGASYQRVPAGQALSLP